jgi:hypothetical protein
VVILLQQNQFVFHRKIVRVNDQLRYLSGSKVMSKEGKPELQVIISFNEPEESKSLYKQDGRLNQLLKL